jgi:hypothetical protein
MKKILIAGCGGAPSEGVVNSLLLGKNQEELIGMGSELTDIPSLMRILQTTKVSCLKY